MRKLSSLAVMMLLLTAVVAVNNAYALGVGYSTHTATVTLPTSMGAFSWEIAFKKVSDNTAATQITWNTADITLGGSDKWVDASVYAVINSTLTRADANIEVYQDNVNSTVYKATFTQDGSSKVYNGLVLSTTSAGSTAGVRADLPFAWRVSTNTKVATDKQTVWPDYYKIDANNKTKSGQYFIDKSDTGYDTDADKKAYRTVLNKEGARFGGGAAEMGGSPSGTFYMYFGAKFDNAMGGMTYGSDKIIFRGYTE